MKRIPSRKMRNRFVFCVGALFAVIVGSGGAFVIWLCGVPFDRNPLLCAMVVTTLFVSSIAFFFGAGLALTAWNEVVREQEGGAK